MNWRKEIGRQLLIVLIGQIIGVAAMYGVFALLNAFDRSVLLGGFAGLLLAMGNFLVMSLSAVQASKKAQQQEVKAGQMLIQGSYMLRMISLFLILFVLVKTGYFHVVSLVVPLIFTRPALTVGEFIRKQGKEEL